MIRLGAAARELADFSEVMGVPNRWLIEILGLSATSVRRRAQTGELLSSSETERFLGVKALFGKAHAMVVEMPGAEGFDVARWLVSWLRTPSALLAGETPGSYMDTIEGQRLVANLLSMMRSGVCA
jgi:uncharacterized protein (DUF2384 family)